jgi:nucleotide-binding universal stress UspA family protein
VISDFARRLGAGVLLLTVATSLDEQPRVELPTWLDEVARSMDGLRVDTVVSDARDPVDAIRDLASAHARSVVGMATHGRGALGSAALGSVAQQALREVDGPFLLVGRRCPTSSPARGPVVVCHDGSRSADAIVGPARAWAGALDLPVVVVEVLHPLDVSIATSPEGDVHGVAERFGPAGRVEVLRSSSPAAAIREYAEKVDASLVAISTHGRTGVARVLGSVAMDLVRHAPCPLLVTRPRPAARSHAVSVATDEEQGDRS